MQKRRVAALAALITVSASVAAAANARADAATTLYVDKTSAACSDSGSGTQGAPFCTIQAAFNAVVAGQTVQVVTGVYAQPATLSASGTAVAPITVQFAHSKDCFLGPDPSIGTPAGSSAALTLSGASYVNLVNVCVDNLSTTQPAVAIRSAAHVSLSGGQVFASQDAVAISGMSSAVTVQRMSLSSAGAAVRVGSGVSGAAITTNYVSGSYTDGGMGIAVDGATGTDIVSNSVDSQCITGVSIDSEASATTIENNVIGFAVGSNSHCGTTDTPVGLSVSSDSVSGTTEKFDTVGGTHGTPVEWAGTTYSSAAAFQATGQGAEDDIGKPALDDGDVVDDADALAPAELPIDFAGNPRVDDPQITNSGTGVGYYDRGAWELQSPLSAEFQTVYTYGALGVFADSYPVDPCGGWGKTYTATLAWGDGQSLSTTGAPCTGGAIGSEHLYANPGTYTMTLTVTDGYRTVRASQSITTDGLEYSPFGPVRILDTRKGIGAGKAKVPGGAHVKLKVAGTAGIPADASAVAANLTVTDATGGGYIAALPDPAGSQGTSNLNFAAGQTVANSTIVQLGADGYIDLSYGGSSSTSVDLVVDVTGYFTPSMAARYATVPLARILDTRRGVGASAAKVAPGAAVTVGVAGVDSIPATASAVAVHLTVTDAAGGGWIAAVPDKSGVPSTSSLNFSQGQTVSNTVIVPVPADGKIQLVNGSNGSVDLIADVSGYFSASAPNLYIPEAPFRALDTRRTGGALKPFATSPQYWLNQGLATGYVAVVANLTVTAPTAGGYLTAYPPGTARPNVSNVNFIPGQTVANLALLVNDPTQPASTAVYNGSAGTTQLLIDVSGFFSAS